MSRHSAHDTRWSKLRARKLHRSPWCECGCGEKATTVDHIKPQSTHPELKYEWNNLQSLSNACHLAKHGKRERGCYEDGTPRDKLHWWNDG